MARSPRASVSKTSGQGVSRLSYQKAYSLGNRGKSAGPSESVTSAKTSTQDTARRRDYGKLDLKAGMNVSYGTTFEPGDLNDLKALAKTPRAK